MFEELTARKNFKTNKEKRPISFTQKSHSIKNSGAESQDILSKSKKW